VNGKPALRAGLGAANVGAGLFQGFTIGASLSKSSAAHSAGMQTQMAGIVAAGLTVIVALPAPGSASPG
jgi:SulP family sulfate permease